MTQEITLRHRELLGMLPRFYNEAPEADGLLYADAVEIERVRKDARDLLTQLSATTATWGLSDWERVLDLPPRPHSTEEIRRSRILAKMRGQGVVTVEHIKNVSESFYGGNVDVIEKNNVYTIIIKFTSSYGIPPNLGDLQDILREIIPAHLSLEYEFNFVTYDILKGTYATYDDVLATGFTYAQLLTDGG